MARDLQRTNMSEDYEPSGLDEFASKRQRVTKDTGESESPVSAGWSIDKRPRVVSGDKPVRFSVPDDGEEVLVKMLESAPFLSFFQHWYATKEGRRAAVCIGKGCPLCAVGHQPKSSDMFNVIDLRDMSEDGGQPILKLWQCSADPAKAIKDMAENKRKSPINKGEFYWAVSKRKGKNNFNTYSFDLVKSDELGDWGIKPLTNEQINAIAENAYTKDIVKVPTKQDLVQIAEEYFGD